MVPLSYLTTEVLARHWNENGSIIASVQGGTGTPLHGSTSRHWYHYDALTNVCYWGCIFRGCHISTPFGYNVILWCGNYLRTQVQLGRALVGNNNSSSYFSFCLKIFLLSLFRMQPPRPPKARAFRTLKFSSLCKEERPWLLSKQDRCTKMQRTYQYYKL
jgi:hypothetical protein